jgi:steroid delta-isomerase-like uncharacterized protein
MAKARHVVAASLDAINTHDEERLRSCYADDVLFEAPGDVRLEGGDAVVEYAMSWLRAFPDARIDVITEVANGDWVAQRFVFEGTHEGTLVGPTGEIPATNRRFSAIGAEFVRVQDGRITEEYLSFDQAEVLTQLGVMPELAGSARA